MIEYIILGCLSMSDMTGYEIKKTMGHSTTFFSEVSFGSLYPALKKLENGGFVTCNEFIDNGRLKKTYHITEDGARLLREWLESPMKHFVFKYDMLVRMFFAANLPEDQIMELIRTHLSDVQSVADDLDQVDSRIGHTADQYQKYTIRFGQAFYRFLMDWWSDLLKELEGKNKN